MLDVNTESVPGVPTRVFQTQRFQKGNKELVYTIPVPEELAHSLTL